ncbi:hypothetical protein D3C80_1052920 [compost metagenome]
MPDTPGEGANFSVVALNRGDEILAGHGNAVFRAFKLGLQGEEVLVRLQVRITLGHHHQAAERPGQLRLRVLELLHFLWIIQRAGIHLDRRRLGPRFDDCGQGFLFLLGITFDRFHQVGDQVGAALVLVLDLPPGRLHLFVVGGNVIDAATCQQRAQCQQHRHFPAPALYRMCSHARYAPSIHGVVNRPKPRHLRHNPSPLLDHVGSIG